jgi:hypothetical protein
MKLPLATGLLSATIIACTGGGSNTANTNTTANKLVMRVDRSLDKGGNPAQKFPDDDIAAESYKPIGQPVDRWEVSIEGSHVILVPVTPLTSNQGQVEGVETTDKAKPGERRFDLQKGVFAGGRFVLRGADDAEVTMYGSGVPIVSSERGKLIKK